MWRNLRDALLGLLVFWATVGVPSRAFAIDVTCTKVGPIENDNVSNQGHPLLPGVRSPEVWNKQWPSVLHDKLLTGFSPLKCGMKQAPRVWATIHPGGKAAYATFLPEGKSEQFLLVLIEPRTGKQFWSRQIEGAIAPDKVRVARLHADFPGKQIAVFPQYVNVAYLFAFPQGRRTGQLVWKTTDATVADWPSRADHGVTTLIEPDGSLIWNIRHHTINTHDPKTGKLLRRFEFNSGGGKRRNYGPSLILDKYVGEVYVTHGVRMWVPVCGLGDADGDGGLDVVYSARVLQPRLQTQTIVCDIGTGKEQVIADTWIAGVADITGDGKEDVMLDYRDFVAVLRGFDGAFIQEPIATGNKLGTWTAYNSFIPLFKPSESKPHFLIPLGHGGVGLLGPDMQTGVWFHKLGYDVPRKVAVVDCDGDGRLEVGYEHQGDGWFVCRDLWTGEEKWRLKLAGAGYGPAISADVDGDGKGEFLIGDYCLGTDSQGKGEVRWRSGVSSTGWPIIADFDADFDADGLGEIVIPGDDGLVRVLKAR